MFTFECTHKLGQNLFAVKEEIDDNFSYLLIPGRTLCLFSSHAMNNRWHRCCCALLGVLPCKQLSFQFTVQMQRQTLCGANVQLFIQTFPLYPSEFPLTPAKN